MAAELSVVACPGCGAAVRAGAPWCTQCFRGLVELPDGVPRSTAASVTAAPPMVPPMSDGTPAWPCTACGGANPMSDDSCAGCGLGFLAQVRHDEPPLLLLPGLGDVTQRSRGQLAVAACGAVLLVVLASLLLFLVLS